MIDDQYIINYFYDTKNVNKINKYKTNNIPENILKYLNNRFTDSESIKETIKRIRYNVEERPKCPICGNPVRWYGHKWNKLFYKTCCDEHENILRKQTTLKVVQEKYGVDNVFQLESVKEKSKQTAFEHYGTTNIAQAKEVREKFKQTCLERYGVENVGGTLESREKAKATCLERYGVEEYAQTTMFKQHMNELLQQGNIQKKRYATHKKNNSFNTSSKEDKLFNILTQHFSTVYRNYNNRTTYPFNCDFYIEDIDYYIEYQGTWLHGYHPYDNTSIDDINKVKQLQEKSYNRKQITNSKRTQYDQAIYIWTINDPLKRKIATENNLNFIEIFPKDNIEKIISLLCEIKQQKKDIKV